MINSFTFNGVSSKDIGLYIGGQNTFGSPQRDITKVSIPGKNGDLIRDNGRFLNSEISYNIVAMADFAETAMAVRNWLLSAKGYARLEDTYHPDHFRMARVSDAITFETSAFNMTGKAQIIFDCKPQRFLKSGETPVDTLPAERAVVFTAGKNISSSNDGIPTDRSDRSATLDGYAVNKGAEYVISLTGSGSVGIFYYDAEDVYFAMEEGWNAVPATFSPPENAAFVRFSYNSGTAPTDARLVCGVPVVFTSGKNINASGEIINNAGRSSTLDGLPVIAETGYTIAYSGSGGVGVFYYDANDTFLSMETGWGTPPSRTFTTPENAAFVRFAYNSGTIPTNAILSCDATIISNPTPFESKPLIRVYGSGDGTVTVGNQIIALTGISDHIDIDSETMNCYNGVANCNSQVTLGVQGFPVLPSGKTGISFDGDISGVEITPRWWEL